jgi:hypothetical protein
MKNNIKNKWFGNVGYYALLTLFLSGVVQADVQVVTAPQQLTETGKCSCPTISRVITCPSGYVMVSPAGTPSKNPTSYTQYSNILSDLGPNIGCVNGNDSYGSAYNCGHLAYSVVCAKVCN